MSAEKILAITVELARMALAHIHVLAFLVSLEMTAK